MQPLASRQVGSAHPTLLGRCPDASGPGELGVSPRFIFPPPLPWFGKGAGDTGGEGCCIGSNPAELTGNGRPTSILSAAIAGAEY